MSLTHVSEIVGRVLDDLGAARASSRGELGATARDAVAPAEPAGPGPVARADVREHFADDERRAS